MKQTQFPKWGEGYHLSLVLNKSWLSENGSGKVEYYACLLYTSDAADDWLVV